MEPDLHHLLCDPGWNLFIGNEALVITCPSFSDATQLTKNKVTTLREWASKFELPVMLKAPDSLKPIKIPPKKGCNMSSSKQKQDVFTAPEIFCWTDNSLAILNRMRETENPMFLIRNADDRQVWVNDRAASIMRSSGNECVIRKVSDYWNPEDLHELYQKLKLKGGMVFEHSYKAKLNDQGLWGQLTAQYQVIEIDGVSYRISTTLNCDVIQPVVCV
jgi:PAS domain-containing protein